MDEITCRLGQIQYSIMSPLPVPPYVGPGDIVTTGWITWIGLRAFSSATKGTAAIRVRRTSDNAEKDFATLANGKLDVDAAYIPGTIVKFYDQSGNSRHLEQATAANQAAINTAGIGSNATADFTSSSSQFYATAATITQSQPMTFTAAVNWIAGAAKVIWGGSGGLSNPALFADLDAANSATIYAGSDVFDTAADGAWHSLAGMLNSGPCDMNIDGVAHTGTNGGANFSTHSLQLGSHGGAFYNGKFANGGMNSAAFTGTQSSDMHSNNSAFWGY